MDMFRNRMCSVKIG